VQQFRLGKDYFGKPNNFENLAHCQLLEINCASMLALGIIMADINVWCMPFVGKSIMTLFRPALPIQRIFT
jgi:hypothetical protein